MPDLPHERKRRTGIAWMRRNRDTCTASATCACLRGSAEGTQGSTAVAMSGRLDGPLIAIDAPAPSATWGKLQGMHGRGARATTTPSWRPSYGWQAAFPRLLDLENPILLDENSLAVQMRPLVPLVARHEAADDWQPKGTRASRSIYDSLAPRIAGRDPRRKA